MAMPETNEAQTDILRTILEEFRHVGEALSALGERQARTETTLTALDSRSARLEQVDTRVDLLDTRITVLETKFVSETGFEDKAVVARRWSMTALISLCVMVGGSLLAFALAHVHWK